MGASIGDFTPKPMPVRDANASVIDMDFNGINSVVRSISNRLSQLVSTVSVLSATAGGGSSVSGANPTGTVGLVAVNGIATTYLRSDGAPALSQAIAPTWTGIHTWAAASDVTQTVHKGFAGQTAALTKWITSASALVASVGISGRYYTANHLEVLDTFGMVSSMAPTTPPTDCSTGLTYIYDTPTYFRSDIWTPTIAGSCIIKGSPLAYGVKTIGTSNLTITDNYTMTSTSNLWTVMSVDYKISVSGRGVYAGSVFSYTGVSLGSTNLKVEYKLDVVAGSLVLSQRVTDHASATTVTTETLGVIAGTYTSTKTIKFTRSTSTSGSVSVSVNGVSVLSGDASGLTGASTIVVVGGWNSVGHYDSGANNSFKAEEVFRNFEIVGNSMTDSCDIGANVDRKIITRQGTEIQIGEANSWTAIRSKTAAGGVIEFLSGTTSMLTMAAYGLSFPIPVTHVGTVWNQGLMGIGTVGPITTTAFDVEGVVTGLTGTTQNGISSQVAFDSTATAAGNSIYVKLFTASAYTMTLGRGIFIDTPSKASGSTITTCVGLDIATQNAGGTNFAIRTGAAGSVQLGILTASNAVFTDSSKNLVSVATIGTGSVVLAASPTITGTAIFAAATFSGTVTHSGLLVLSSQTFNNVAVSVTAGVMYLAQTGTMSASRVVTLPAASAYPRGTKLIIADESGTCSATNTLVITRAGSDTINGATTKTIGIVGGYDTCVLMSDGTSKWTVISSI